MTKAILRALPHIRPKASPDELWLRLIQAFGLLFLVIALALPLVGLFLRAFEDQQGSSIKRKVGQFATWEQLLSAIRSEFEGRQVIPQF